MSVMWLKLENARCVGELKPSWLCAALAAADVPRAGLAAEQKAAYEQAMLEAKGKSHFKASLKQLCGGKKKRTAGTPPSMA